MIQVSHVNDQPQITQISQILATRFFYYADLF